MTADDSLLQFDDSQLEPVLDNGRKPWRILVVDDEVDVHHVTMFSLSDRVFFGRSVVLEFAFSANEAMQVLESDRDWALILVDVVMESDSAGLELVSQVRDRFQLHATRIILRTGQPGYAPEIATMLQYDINDYRAKTELTHTRLVTTVAAALRSYEQLCALDSNRRGLEQIVEASASLMQAEGLQAFAAGVVTQLCAILGATPDGLVCAQAEKATGQYKVLAAAGRYSQNVDRPIDELFDHHVSSILRTALDTGRNVITPTGLALYFGERDGLDMAAFIEAERCPSTLDQKLLDLFCANMSACLRNHRLVERLQDLAYVDPLTALPNRTKFIAEVEQALGTVPPTLNIALVDIDDFGSINQVMGHAYGDRLLLAFSQRLSAIMGPETQVARISSNTFGLLGGTAQVNPEQVLTSVETPLIVDGTPRIISVTSGFATLNQDHQSGEDWIKNVTIALKHSKRNNRGTHVSFTRNIGIEERARSQLLTELKSALVQKQLSLAYQPQIDLIDGHVVGVEALLRWKDETGRQIPPNEFVPLAEQSGLILPIGAWVLRRACEDMARLEQIVVPPKRMAVNVSVAQFRQPGFVAQVNEQLQRSGLQPSQLELEVTESVAMLGHGVVESTLAELRRDQISVAMDDFGTGYSSLSYLNRMAFDRLKIDRSFVMQLNKNQGHRIAEMVVQLGNKLGVTVIAEGIEDEDSLRLLLQMGCREGQGYHIARPMPFEDLVRWLQVRQAALV